MRRGEIYTAATGSGFGIKPRPVLVFQANDNGNGPNSVVALIGTARGEGRDLRPRITPNAENGLRELSDVSVDIITTVPRRKFGQLFGRLSHEDQERVDRSLLLILGLGLT